MNTNKKDKKDQSSGSALVLTLIAVMLLSGMAITGLTVSSVEVQSTQNFFLNKRAYYTAMQGVEAVRNEIFRQPDPSAVSLIKLDKTETTDGGGTNYSFYITGSLEDLSYYIDGQITETQSVGFFQGFPPPPLPGISLTGNAHVAPVIWRVNISAVVNQGKRKSYSEIESGVYSIVTVAY